MCSPTGSSVPGISKARILERVAIPSRGDLPDPGIEPAAPELQADSSSLSHQGSPYVLIYMCVCVCVCVCMYIHMCVCIYTRVYIRVYIYISDQISRSVVSDSLRPHESQHPGGSAVKNLPVMQETWVRSLGREDPWRREWQPIPVSLPGKCPGLRSLVGYSPH